MKHGHLFAIVAVAALGSFGCNKVEGVYTLDKEEMKKAMQAESSKDSDNPLAQQLAEAFISELDARMEIQPGGTFTLLAKLGEKEGDPRKGTWKKEGNAIVLQLEDDQMKCEQDASKRLACGSDADKLKMIFVKAPQ